MDKHRPYVSFVLATHERRSVVSATLARLCKCGLDRGEYEIVVVDNASSDGTAKAIADRCDTLVRLDHNAGSCAKAHGVRRATGRYVVFLDDDSSPRAGSVPRMIHHFEDDPALGAAGFVVHLPDGRLEGGALPDVFIGCGVGFQSEALRAAGGLDCSFFMQAEEYDLTFRLVAAGWRVRMFDDLHVDHLKTTDARRHERITFYDVRNNLRVLSRYLHSPRLKVYRTDLLQRYRWLAQRDGHAQAYVRGAWAGLARGAIERRTHRRYRLSAEWFEHFYRWRFVHRRMAGLVAEGVRRIVLADLGKNVFAYHRAAKATGVEIVAIGDDRFAAPQRRYRGTPVVGLEEALRHAADAVVVANSSAVHGTDTYHRWSDRTRLPVFHWFPSADQPAAAEVTPIRHRERTATKPAKGVVPVGAG